MLSSGGPSNIAKFIEEHATRSRLSYKDIAILAGFSSDAVLYKFMRGEAAVPLDCVPGLAGALGCDGAQLFVLALQSNLAPDTVQLIEETFMNGADLDGIIGTWVRAIREIYGGKVPPLTVELRRRLELVLRTHNERG
jgi:hypothetical protein